jgi:hypothetical protein
MNPLASFTTENKESILDSQPSATCITSSVARTERLLLYTFAANYAACGRVINRVDLI